MLQFNVVKLDRVICDQTLVVQDVGTDIRIQQPIVAGSVFDLQQTVISVTVAQSNLKINNDKFQIDLELNFNKHFLILQPGEMDVPINFSYNKAYPNLLVTKYQPAQIPKELWPRLFCQAYDVKFTEELFLNDATATFNEILTITLVMKILFTDQIVLGPPSPPIPPQPPGPPEPVDPSSKWPFIPILLKEVDCLLSILEGKIRSQIENHSLKAQLLTATVRVRRLLEEKQVMQAMVLLNTVANLLQISFNFLPGSRTGIGLVFYDLSMLLKELLKYVE